MTSTMTSAHDVCGVGDPAANGDPWCRLRYHYGQLLGAEDFTQEQRSAVLRHRLHLALAHGSGTLWGLKVTGDETASKLTVAPGLAVDALGREIHVPRDQCLADLDHLHENQDLWRRLKPVLAAETAVRPRGDVTALDEDDVAVDAATAADLHELAGAAAAAAAAAGDEAPAVAGDGDGDGDGDGIDDTEGLGDGEDVDGDAPTGVEVRRAFVVLKYRACLSQPVPAISPVCSSDEDSIAYGRVCDDFCIELVAEPPADPHDLVREWLGRAGDVENPRAAEDQPPRWNSLRDRLVDVLLNCDVDAPDLCRFWSGLEDASVMLAAIDLAVDTTGDGARTTIRRVDNRIRPLLPPVQLMAEELFGQRLVGHDQRRPLKVLAVSDLQLDGDARRGELLVELSAEAAPRSVNRESVQIWRYREATGWKQLAAKAEAEGRHIRARLKLSANQAFADGDLYQLRMAGEEAAPVVTTDGRPLAGFWDEPVPGLGRGRNVCLVRTWHPTEEE